MRWTCTAPQRLAAAGLACLAGLMSACTLPSLQPFAESTAQIHAAVLKTDTDVPVLLREANKADAAAEMDRHLALRVQAMNGVLKYAESLAHITAAGQTGTQAAGKVADSLNGLLGAIKVAPLAGEAVSLVAMAYGYVAQVRAASAFSEAVERADPAVQGIAAILDKDLRALEDLLLQMRIPLSDRVINRTPENVALQDFRNGLERERRRLEKALDPATLNADSAKRVQDIAMLIEQTRERWEPLRAEQRAVVARVDGQIALMKKTRQALGEWAAVHGELAGTVKAGLRPNTAVLYSIASQIQKLVDGSAAK